MKQAILALVTIASFAVTSAAVAYKVNRGLRPFFGLTTILNAQGQKVSVCTVEIDLASTPNAAGTLVIPFSSAFNMAPVTTCTAIVVPAL